MPPSNAGSSSNYYPEIDSLRAFAVASVVLFHLGWGIPASGFAGVDVFFVISGFVVSLSMAEVPAQRLPTFTTYFYARRLLRIAPALIVCLLATVFMSCLFIPHAWLSEANRATGLGAFFGVSNLELARPANDYFAPRAEFNPFTHTWSLAVEEQFYLVFPLLMFFFLRGGGQRVWATRSLVGLSILTLACCAWWMASRPTFAFYLIVARFWELALGVGLFMSMQAWKPHIADIRRGVARGIWYVLAGLLLACVFSPSRQGFPFPWAIPTVVFTTAIIAFTVGAPGAVPRWASNPGLVYVGKISYSLYLWHWPVLVLLRWTVGLETAWSKALALLLSILLAAASQRWVELPMRYLPRIRIAPKGMIVAASLAAVGLSAAGAMVMFDHETALSLSVTRNKADWLPDSAQRPPEVSVMCDLKWDWQTFHGGVVRTYEPMRCTRERPAGRVFVVGDSHAEAYSSMLRLYADSVGREVRVLTKGGCSLFNLLTPISEAPPSCSDFDAAVLKTVADQMVSGDLLFLPSLRVPRWQDQWGAIREKTPPEKAAASRRAAVSEAQPFLASLVAKGVRVVFELPKPIYKSPPFRCSDWFNSRNPICAGGFETTRDDQQAYRKEAVQSIETVVSQLPGATVWDPLPMLCPDNICSAYRKGRPLYFDGDHLSGYGNLVLFASFSKHIASVMDGSDPRRK